MKNLSKLSLIALIFALFLVACNTEDENENTFSETESNNEFATATDLTLGDTYDAKIDPVMDIDYFKVSATGDVKITVAGKGSLEVRVHAFTNEEIDFFGEDAGDRGATLTKTISASDYEGFFYINVESAYGNDTGTYTIKAE